jgi:hypothetical protein
VARREPSGEKRLVAYVAAEPGQVTTTELRGFLKEKLPEHMIPPAFVVLDALPLSPNGKVDRRALPTPDAARPVLEQSFVLPRNPIEEALARIWAEVLKLDRIGVLDNFFDLGGHSLLATQVASRITAQLHVPLTLRSLFEEPTIAGLARTLTELQAEQEEPGALDQLLAEIEALSDEQARALLTGLP